MAYHHNHTNQNSDKNTNKTSGAKRFFWLIPVMLVAAVGAYFIYNNYWSGLGNNWLILMLLICPLIHLFMHGGHGKNNHE